MILKALSDYAERVGLIGGMDVKERLVHLVLCIDHDGHLLNVAPWILLDREVPELKKGTMKREAGKLLRMPEFPGVNAGGKAHFLADSAEKVLGLFAKTGEPIPADGKNPVKAFEHYWKRIADAFAETKDAELDAILKFRDHYLTTSDRKESLAPIVGVEPVGKEGKLAFSAKTRNGPVPLEGRTITFKVGATSPHVFAEGSPLRDFWKAQFKRERFVEQPADSTANCGVCLVTGDEDVPIAEVHRTLIKGVPGLPPIGGYMVSFDEMTPSLRSYGFEKGWNAPVSEDAAAAYALGLNDLLSNRETRQKLGGNAVLCSWVDINREAGAEFLTILNALSADAVSKFIEEFKNGRFRHAFEAGRYRSVTLAANGGRVVVRRWLDEPLKEVVNAVETWFKDLDIEAIEVPRKAEKSKKRKDVPGTDSVTPTVEPSSFSSPLSIYALVGTTARVASEVQSTTYDLLYRAALDVERCSPQALLAPVLQRLRIAAVEHGNAIRFHTSRFALIKLILNRSEARIMSEDRPLAIKRELAETDDPAYNCGRLLALLDDMQYQAHQGEVGADVVARFYGNASTFPANVFSRLLRLEKHHRAKARKDPKTVAAAIAIGRKMDDVIAIFPQSGPRAAPDFPGVLSLRDQGRFAIGFHQQKAESERERKARKDARLATDRDTTENTATADPE
ncbi:MAG: CRISPR-associated protein Cas8c/Csd1, subtype [Planctomycetota bacterium]|nr:CRISPR-associated protein Cas8c/Csd1, subtype [Planctomycetota bacterium]